MSLEMLKENIAKHWSRISQNKPDLDKEAYSWRENLSFWQRLEEFRNQIMGAIILYSNSIGAGYRLAYSEASVPASPDPQPLTTQLFQENSLFGKIVAWHSLIAQIRQEPHNN